MEKNSMEDHLTLTHEEQALLDRIQLECQDMESNLVSNLEFKLKMAEEVIENLKRSLQDEQAHVCYLHKQLRDMAEKLRVVKSPEKVEAVTNRASLPAEPPQSSGYIPLFFETMRASLAPSTAARQGALSSDEERDSFDACVMT